MIIPRYKLKRQIHVSKFPLLFFVFVFNTIVTKAQQVTEIITDFAGYWRTTATANNAILPNDSHNLLAFKVGTTFYSTGVNNSVLTSNAINFTIGNFKCLPITSITGMATSAAPSVIALAGNYDGVPNGYSNPLPTVKMKDVLTDGINGLNIGTGVIDVPVSARLTFPIQSIDSGSIADAKPDIVFTQIANIPTGYNDTMYFINSSGVVVGNKIIVSWSSVPALGTYTLDFYDIQTGVTCDQAAITAGNTVNTTRPIRLTAYKLSDFGITSLNKAFATSLILKPSGKSDIGFVAYNSDGFVIAPPTIVQQPQSQIVCTGASSSATFTVTATGTSNNYQWRRDGADIVGATNSIYTISPVTSASAGTYEVVITNLGGTITSNKAYLNIEITKQPLSQTLVTGNTVRLSVTASNSNSYQWNKNGTPIAGAIDSVYTINPLTTTDIGSYTVTAINSANGGCATISSNPATITPIIVVYSKSTGNLNLPASWGSNADGSGSTPVDFTRSEHTFVLSNRASGNTITDLKIAGTLDVSNSIAMITDSTTLDVGWCKRTGTGSIYGSSSAGLTVRGNSDLYFTDSSQVLKNFTITGGTVNMLSSLIIYGGRMPGTLNLTGGTLALNGNKITLASTTTTNTSMVTPIGATVAITYGNGGAFIIHRFVPAKRSFRFMSPSVTTTTSIKANWMEGVVNPDRYTNNNPLPGFGTHITGPKSVLDSLDVTQTYNPSLFTFDKNSQTWNPVPNSQGILTAGSPYRLMVRGSRSVDLNDNEAAPSNTIIRTTGKLTTGDLTVGPSILSTKVGTYTFIGNPYACPINWTTLTKSGVASAYYTWDEKPNKRGAMVSYNASSQTNSFSALSSIDENIQAGQGFLVQSTSSAPSIVFTEGNKSYNNTDVFRGSSISNPKLSVQLLLNLEPGTSNIADGFVEVFNNNFSKSVGDEDSYKFTNLDENIAINRNGTLLSIEGRPFILSPDTIPVKMWQFRQKSYFLKIDASNFSTNTHATVIDTYLNQRYAISMSAPTIIPFAISTDSASLTANRFSIVFDQPSLLPITLTKIRAVQKEKGIQVIWTNETEVNVQKYELEKSENSQQFHKLSGIDARLNNGSSATYSLLDERAESDDNFYRVKVTERTGTEWYSAVVKVALKGAKSHVSVFPNPIKGNTFSLHLTNMVYGQYDLEIFDNQGKKVYSSSINHSINSSSQTISIPNQVPSGKYNLQLSSSKMCIIKSISFFP